jgi:hypothetical protein
MRRSAYRRVRELEDVSGTLTTRKAALSWQIGKAGEAKQMSVASMDPGTLETTHNLASVLGNQGKYKVVIHEKMLRHEHPDVLLSMDNLANIVNS